MKNNTTFLFNLSKSTLKHDKSIFAHSTFSNISPFSEQWCKEKKAELFKKRFPAIFEDMSQIKNRGYLAITNLEVNPFSLHFLKSIPGIYMISNKVTKKIYIGMSIDLKGRIRKSF